MANNNDALGLAAELHQNARRYFDRRCTTILGLRDLWQIDLLDMGKGIVVQNKEYRYALVVICCFSKYAFAEPLKKKNAAEVTQAMKSILESGEKRFLKPPKFIQSDKGSEFHNKDFKSLLAQYNIQLYYTGSYSTGSTKMKCAIVERFIRTIKSKMFRNFTANFSCVWMYMLPQVIKEYNNSYHRTIKMKPNDVTPQHEFELRMIYKKNADSKKRGKIKFKIGDIVRISKYKETFTKGYEMNWSLEVYDVVKVCDTKPVTYKLKCRGENEVEDGCFYSEQLLKTKYPNIHAKRGELKRMPGDMRTNVLEFLRRAHNP